MRHEYQLTRMGRELGVPVIGLMHWGDRHLAGPTGPPRLTRHHECGGDVQLALACDTCGARVGPGEVELLAGPGAAQAGRE